MPEACIMTSVPDTDGNTFAVEVAQDAASRLTARGTLEIAGIPQVPLTRVWLKRYADGPTELWIAWEGEVPDGAQLMPPAEVPPP